MDSPWAHTGLSLIDEGALHLLPLEPDTVKRAVQAMLERSGSPGAGVEIVCVRDCAMAVLNAEHMGRKGPTNVLSFPSGDTGPQDFLGSLVISSDTVQREAMLYGHNTAEYCLGLIAHGLAHLAGFEHGPAMDAFINTINSTSNPSY